MSVKVGMSTDCTGLAAAILAMYSRPAEINRDTGYNGLGPELKITDLQRCALGDPMQSKSKVSRKPKATKVQTVVLEQTVKSSKRPARSTRRTGPRAFQQPNPTRSRPAKVGIRTKRKGDVAIVPGEDLVATIASDSKGYSAGDVIVDQIINPAVLNVTRLTTLAKLYKKYRIASMSFSYEPTATIEPGSLLGYIDYDALDDPSIGTGLERLQRARASFGEKGVNITNKGTWTLVPMKEPLYIESDSVTGIDHWHRYARFVVYANSAIAASKACGSIIMRYQIEFSHPSYQTPVTSLTSAPLGYAWRSHWNASSQTIDESKVWEVSDLKMGVTEVKTTSGPHWTLSFPYRSESKDLNQYQIFAYTESYTEAANWSLSAESGLTVIGHVSGKGGSSGYYSCYMAMVESKASSNSVAFSFFTPSTSQNVIVQIACIPYWAYSMMSIDVKDSKELKEPKDNCDRTSSSSFVLVPSVSQSSSSSGSGTQASLPSAPTPLNSPLVRPGWFRS